MEVHFWWLWCHAVAERLRRYSAHVQLLEARSCSITTFEFYFGQHGFGRENRNRPRASRGWATRNDGRGLCPKADFSAQPAHTDGAAGLCAAPVAPSPIGTGALAHWRSKAVRRSAPLQSENWRTRLHRPIFQPEQWACPFGHRRAPSPPEVRHLRSTL